MKKSILAVAILGILSANASFAENKQASSGNEASVTNASSVKAIIEEIAAAAQSGDEQLVAKLLNSAIKSNPKIADKIVASFIESQSVISSNPKNSTVNIASIINNVIASLQSQPGNETLVAAILNSYTPASGGEAKKAGDDKLPPALPTAGVVGGNQGSGQIIEKEEPGKVSAN